MDFVGIRTQSIGIEDKNADHNATTFKKPVMIF